MPYRAQALPAARSVLASAISSLSLPVLDYPGISASVQTAAIER